MDRTRRFMKLKERKRVTTLRRMTEPPGALMGAWALSAAAGGETSGPGQDRVFYSHQGDPHLQDGTSSVPGTAAETGDEPAGDSESGPAHAWCATNNPAFSSL